MRSPQSKSLLGRAIGGDYNNFLWQRYHLKKLYRDKFGEPRLGEESVRTFPTSQPTNGFK